MDVFEDRFVDVIFFLGGQFESFRANLGINFSQSSVLSEQNSTSVKLKRGGNGFPSSSVVFGSRSSSNQG